MVRGYKLTHRLLGVANGLEAQIAESLNGALETVTAKILILSQKAEQTESLTRRRQYLKKQKAEIEKVLNEVYAGIGKTIKDNAIEVGQTTPEVVDSIVKKTIKIELAVPHLDKKLLLPGSNLHR